MPPGAKKQINPCRGICLTHFLATTVRSALALESLLREEGSRISPGFSYKGHLAGKVSGTSSSQSSPPGSPLGKERLRVLQRCCEVFFSRRSTRFQGGQRGGIVNTRVVNPDLVVRVFSPNDRETSTDGPLFLSPGSSRMGSSFE